MQQKFNRRNPVPYFFEIEKLSDTSPHLTLSKEAEELEQFTTFSINSINPKEKLRHLEREIHVNLKISKEAIFRIGELLCMAKKICQDENIRFKLWIKKCFGISYETANNFENVYKQCLGYKSIALNVPSSILYKISAKNIDEELREWFFINTDLKTIKNDQFKKLVKKYRKGGIEAIQEDIELINKKRLIFRQTNYTLDLCESANQNLKDLREALIKKDGFDYRNIEEDIEFQNGLEPIASEVILKLHSTLNTAIKLFEEAINESQNKLRQFDDSIFDEV